VAAYNVEVKVKTHSFLACVIAIIFQAAGLCHDVR